MMRLDDEIIIKYVMRSVFQTWSVFCKDLKAISSNKD